MSEHAEIEFCSMSDVEIPTAIAQSKFLITDFSSVAVDFLFQQKMSYFINIINICHIMCRLNRFNIEISVKL